ncbi:hypothetical protein BACDOR_01940 [Phocaeicola dorei DSM 17855]|uniref:Uncharacterized protein n=1 Tax=Phocaeicola dorei DSM 17855 TaxID=483217 RepID=B6VXD1_9BACT|nr:hypothetical protein BACDOR_01940 [Phocaeicola dorei DSM 17855]
MSHPVLFYRKRIKLPWITPHSRTQFLSYYLSELRSGKCRITLVPPVTGCTLQYRVQLLL